MPPPRYHVAKWHEKPSRRFNRSGILGGMTAEDSFGTIRFADDWEELSTLSGTASQWGRYGRLVVTVVFVLGIVGGEWIDHSVAAENAGSYFFLICFGVILVILVSMGYIYARLFSWKCPRCHRRWPGLLNKAALCNSCGLRLNQDS